MKVSCDCDGKLCTKWHPEIEAALRKAAAKAQKENREFKADMSSLARAIGISRPTLYRHSLFIENMLSRMQIERRRVDGDAARSALMEKLERVEAQRNEALKEIEVLRQSLAQLYQTLALNARPLAALVEAQLQEHGIEGGICPLCGGDNGAMPTPSTNVVPLARKDQL